MNDNDKMGQEEMQIMGEKIINGFHDAFEQAQKELGHGIPVVLLASIIGSEINLISGKEPRFLEMVLAACDRQLNVQESPYVGVPCPNCKRHRVEQIGDKRVCEKCNWCIEDDFYYETPDVRKD